MTELEKRDAGELYNPGQDRELGDMMNVCKDMCHEYNLIPPSHWQEKSELLKKLIGTLHGSACLMSPFQCDYGTNIELGENFYANHNCVMLDAAKITFGKNVFCGPDCCFSTSGHPLDAQERDSGNEFAYPITVGDSVWFGARVTVVPGVTIGSNVVIGAGSVVTKDIPSGVVAAGVPCRVMRPITDADKMMK